MNPQDRNTQDSPIQIQDISLAPDKIAQYIAQNKVTVQQIAKVEFNLAAGLVVLGILTAGLDVQSKVSLQVAYQHDDFLANQQNPGGFHAFEVSTPQTLQFKDLDKVIAALATATDAKTGRPATDLYVPIPEVHGRLVQCMYTPKQQVQVLNPVGQPGVASIRFVAAQAFLLALLTDSTGQAKGLATLPLSVAQANTQTVGKQPSWQMHGTQTKRDVISLARPKASRDGTVKNIVNLDGGYECPVAAQKHGKEFKMTWGQEQRTKRVAIGIVNGTDKLYASFQPQQRAAEIWFETAELANQAAQQYMQA
ncbi:hypothetical protein HY479_00940 [Candidatus Uhrbacteria bacterium]|nr:hypothetical protein [Candidatus Uhrbacteria bacterium]